MQRPRPEIRTQLSRRDSLREPLGSPAAQLRPRPACGEVSVQEHGQPQLFAEEIAENQGFRAGRALVCPRKVNDRRYIDRPDPGMNTFVAGDIDPTDCLARAAEDAGGELPRGAGKGKNAAVVVGIGVDVEQSRCECGPDRLDRAPVAAFGHVRDRQQRRAAHLLP